MTPKIPNRFFERLQSFMSKEDFQIAMSGFDAKNRKAAFRINTLQSNAQEVEEELQKRGIRFEKFEWLLGAYTLPKEDEFSLKGSRAFYDGKIYVQSLASQIPAHFLKISEGALALDVCAAPGSKTTQMAMLSGKWSHIVAIEQSPVRAEKLKHNIKLQGASNVEVVRIPAENYLQHPNCPEFDAILLDAPCSSEGRIRFEDEKTFSFWREGNIAKRASIGWELLELAWSRLKSGGELLYSTCTLAPEENEAIISKALASLKGAELIPIELSLPFSRSGITQFGKQSYDTRVVGTKRILPCPDTEGFFIAKLRKN